MELPIRQILPDFNLDPESFKIERIGSGHINLTYKLAGEKSFVLQRINKNVFTKPEIIESNLRNASAFLSEKFSDYFFMGPLLTSQGAGMTYDPEGYPWRLYPYIENTYTIDQASTVDEACEAAAEFGKLGRLLSGCRVYLFHPTIDRFHDLALRYQQFEDALRNSTDNKRKDAQREIELAKKNSFLAARYAKLVQEGTLTLSVFHNDTKINNVLFDSTTRKTVAVIDLDTLMPGYFIYDLGDLLRTLVSPVSEEEKDLEKIVFRKDFCDAVVDGYLSEMNTCLSEEEKRLVSFAGPMMTYIMALRFLADFLRGDTYYQTHYPGQNLVRARNQLRLLELLLREAKLS